jgi:hypothetical protein
VKCHFFIEKLFSRMKQVSRLMMALWFALLFGAVPANAGDIPARSPLGIDYMALTEGDAQLAELLLAGEAEWMQSGAKEEFAADAGVEFEDNANLLKKGKVTKGMLRDLMQYSPQMVSSFIDLPRERYPLLQAIGALAKSQDDLAKSQEDLAKSQEDLAKSQEDLAKSQEDLAKSQEYLAKSQKMLEQAQAIAKAFGGKN